MDDFFLNNKQLIAEVKKRPELYDVTDLNYYNRNIRDEKWIELFQVLVPHWCKLSSIEQQSFGLSIKKKWRSMRDSFAKDIRKRSNPIHASTSRRYIYFNQMKFILPSLTKRKDLDGVITDASITDDLQADDESSVESENDGIDETPQSANISLVESTEDEDKMFLLSLLPLYKSMKKDSKLVGRIKMLEALRNVIQENCYDSLESDKSLKGKDDGNNVKKSSGDGQQRKFSQEDDDDGEASLNSPSFSPRSDVKSEPTSLFLLDTEDDPLLTPNEDSSPPPPKRHKTDHQKPAQNSISVVSPALSTTSTSDDIFEAIGKNVAYKLRRMAQQQRIIAEKIIGDVMYHGQMEMLTVNSYLALDK